MHLPSRRDRLTPLAGRLPDRRGLDIARPSAAPDQPVHEYAMPLSGEALRLITGLNAVSAREMDAYSQAMIDGIANYGGDPEIESRCLHAVAILDAAIDDRLADFRKCAPDPETLEGVSVIAVLQRAGAPDEEIRANVKLVISGGQNEPRDAIAGAIWACSRTPISWRC